MPKLIKFKVGFEKFSKNGSGYHFSKFQGVILQKFNEQTKINFDQ